MSNVFDGIDLPVDVSSWRPPEFPLIASRGIREIEMDCETNGLDWWNRDILGGVGYYLPNDECGYLPLTHKGGNNLPVEAFDEWSKRELRDVHITNLNTRFDIHTLYRHGVDLEAQGCTVSDVGHYAALLNDSRQKFSLESIVNDYLKDEQKVLSVYGQRLEGSRMMDYAAGVVAVRAIADCRQVHKLKKLLVPLLEEQDLLRVKELEDQIIYPVCEMERNGSPINRSLLNQWLIEVSAEIQRLREDLAAMLGHEFQPGLFEGGKASPFLNPNSPREMEALFHHLKLPIARTKTRRASFAAGVMKSHKGHPVVDRLIKLSKLLDLDKRYIHGTAAALGVDDIFRYALHQLRAQKDEHGESGEAGTISGRFSSTEIMTDVGDNIQQRIKVAKQRISFGYDENDPSHDDKIFLIRRLHVTRDPNQWFLSADAKQIEYRVFAHFANNQTIIRAFQENPDLSFHKYTHAKLKPFVEKLTNDQWPYRKQKDLNFAKVYGAGLKKLALMLGFITQEQFEELNDKKAKNSHPWLKNAAIVNDIYNQELPEVGPLLRRASHLAMENCNDYCHSEANGKPDDLLHRTLPHRGFVKTLLGRRARFPNNYRSHKAFNAVDQGTSADIMKWKIIELHRERKYTQFTMRFVVHDEFDGDIPDIEHAKRVREILDRQTFPVPLRVPIRWDVSLGKNWAECGADSASLDEILKERREALYARSAA